MTSPYLPLWQFSHSPADEAENFAFGHAIQIPVVETGSEYFPATQAEQVEEDTVEVVKPDPQVEQAVEPTVDENVPISQI